nr:hypothetical protein CFP56_35129 [Quercus suber]
MTAHYPDDVVHFVLHLIAACLMTGACHAPCTLLLCWTCSFNTQIWVVLHWIASVLVLYMTAHCPDDVVHSVLHLIAACPDDCTYWKTEDEAGGGVAGLRCKIRELSIPPPSANYSLTRASGGTMILTSYCKFIIDLTT